MNDRIDTNAIAHLCDSGHRLVACADGAYRCLFCTYELRVVR